jgi:hypothetical protein
MVTKRERFEKVAVTRVNKIIKDLRLLGNCSNKNNYEYSEKDVKKIFSAIDLEVKKMKAKYLGKDLTEDKFKL